MNKKMKNEYEMIANFCFSLKNTGQMKQEQCVFFACVFLFLPCVFLDCPVFFFEKHRANETRTMNIR